MSTDLQCSSSAPELGTASEWEQGEDMTKAEKSAVVTDAEEADADSAAEEETPEEAEAPEAPRTAMQQLVALGDKVCRLLTRPRDLIHSGLASQTGALAAALRPMPAATVGSLAMGLPHAHPAHPPYVPLMPLGPALVGFSNDVLINGMPALLNGALGLSPTCCGLTPFYEVFTGSSKVLIGGERAVRVLDLTVHCAPSAPRPHQEARVSARLRQTLQAADHALHAVKKAEDAADFAIQRSEAGQAVRDAETSDSPALREAADTSLATATISPLAEKAQEQLSHALLQLMGRDPAAPAGTPGIIAAGSANVLIGGFPMPGGSAVIRGLLRLVP